MSSWRYGSVDPYGLNNPYVPLTKEEKQSQQPSSPMPSINPMSFMNMGGSEGGMFNFGPAMGGGSSAGSGAASSSGSAAGGGISGSLGGLGPYAALAALVLGGKSYESDHPDTVVGKMSSALLGPSIPQMQKDPRRS